MDTTPEIIIAGAAVLGAAYTFMSGSRNRESEGRISKLEGRIESLQFVVVEVIRGNHMKERD